MQYILRPTRRDDIKTFGALNTIYWNSQNENPMPLQDLFDIIYQSYQNGPLERDASQELIIPATSASPPKITISDGSHPATNDNAPGKVSSTAPTLEKSAAEGSESKNLSSTASASWPKDVPLPSGEVKCDLEPYEKIELDKIVNANPKQIFDLIFDCDSQFFNQLRKRRKDWDYVLGPWCDGNDSIKKRENKWTMAVNNPMVKAKEALCFEEQYILRQDAYNCYVVDSFTRTPDLPYGDAFQSQQRFVITFVSPTSSRLLISIGVKWFKNPMIKSIIKSATIKGLQDALGDFMFVFHEELPKIAPQAFAGEPSPVASVLAVSSERSSGAANSSGTGDGSREAKRQASNDGGRLSMILNAVEDLFPGNLSVLIIAFLALSAALNFWLLFFRHPTPHPVTFDNAVFSTSYLGNSRIAGVRFTDIEKEVLNSTLSLRQSARDTGRLKRHVFFIATAA